MRALWLENQRVSFRTDLPIPSVKPGQCLVQVLLAGVCGTDLELIAGYYPFRGIPGHEFVGQVVAAPEYGLLVGRRVVGEINIACGMCSACLAGRRTHCERRQVLGILGLNGAFAEYLVLPRENIHIIPDEIADENAVFTEPLAAALEISVQVPVSPGDRWVVVGAGRLGQLVAQVLGVSGAMPVVVARHALQRRLLEQRGIRWIGEEDVTSGQADKVVDTTGTPQGFNLARKAVRPGGTIVLKSTYKGDSTINLSRIVVDEITLVGSRCGPFPPALVHLVNGTVEPRNLIQASYPLEQGLQALEHASRPGVLKILLKP